MQEPPELYPVETTRLGRASISAETVLSGISAASISGAVASSSAGAFDKADINSLTLGESVSAARTMER